jgi:hypothetical protein
MDNNTIPQAIRDRFPWAFVEPNPADVVARMKEGALRVLSATTSPPGYGTAPERAED